MRSLKPEQKLIAQTIATALALMAYGGAAHAQRALDEVIVTAQKKDDTLQTVPMSVNAVTADTISKYNLLDFKDIQSVTPGLTIKSQDTRTATIAMRGVNVLTDSGYGPGVAVYWNEVNYDIDSAFTGMYDVGQIEVLRGPQGTLRGITAPAGAVTIMTKAPSFSEVEGTIEQTFGERDLSNTQFGMSLPIIEDKLAMRIAGLYDHNKTDGIENVVNGKENSSLTRSGRLTLALYATDALELSLTHQYMESNRAGNSIVEGCGNQSNETVCLDAFDRKSVNPTQSNTFARMNDTVLRVEWDLGQYALTSITGYRDQWNNVLVDQDIGNALPVGSINLVTGEAANQLQTVQSNIHTFTQEVRFSTQDAEFWNWTYGLYGTRYRSNTKVEQEALLSFYSQFPANSGFYVPYFYGTQPLVISAPGDSEGYAAFTNHSFQWTDALETQIGLRYQSNRTVQSMTIDGVPSWGEKAVDEGVTGTASVSYQWTDDVRVYATYGRSFRAGGFAIAPQTPSDYTQYEPETSDSIELGFKSRLADGRVQVNGSIYYQKYHDFLARTQQGVRTVGGAGGPGNDFLNYNANAVSKGAELQVDALLTDDWQVGVGISYNDAKFTDGDAYCTLYDANNIPINPTPNADGIGVNTCEAKGRLAGEPNWGISANSEYTLHFDAVDSFVRAQYSFASGRSDDSQANSVLDTSSYGLWNLFVGVRDPKKVWEVSVWAKNLFDKEQIVRRSPEYTLLGTGLDTAGFDPEQVIGFVPDASNLAFASGYNAVQVIPERQFGITGKYNFSL
jgi:iron complex outermembrane recepter protein